MEAAAKASTIAARKALVAGAVLLLTLAAGYGGWQWYSHSQSRWLLKWKIKRHLTRESSRSHFNVAFEFPPAEQMQESMGSPQLAGVNPDEVARVERNFDVIKSSYIELQKEILSLRREISALEKQPPPKAVKAPRGKTNAVSAVTGAEAPQTKREAMVTRERELAEKEKAVAPLLADLELMQRAWAKQRRVREETEAVELTRSHGAFAKEHRELLEGAESYRQVYHLLGQQLWVADRLLDSRNAAHRRVGLRMARQAGRDALEFAADGWLASAIYRAYVWPRLEVLARMPPVNSVEAALADCGEVFRLAEDRASLIQNYSAVVRQGTNAQRSDWARVQLGMAHESWGELEEALGYFKAVKLTNQFPYVVRRLQVLERRLAARAQ